MTIFDQTEAQFEHCRGKLVKYDNQVLVVGGNGGANVEEMNHAEFSWSSHAMSPVNNLTELEDPTVLSLEKSLFIFGMFRLLKCKLK